MQSAFWVLPPHCCFFFRFRRVSAACLSGLGILKTVDLMRLAGLKSFGALCGPTNPDGGMARLPDVADFGLKRDFPVIIVANLIFFRNQICGGGYERTR